MEDYPDSLTLLSQPLDQQNDLNFTMKFIYPLLSESEDLELRCMQIEGTDIKEYDMRLPYSCRIRINQMTADEEIVLFDNPQVSKRRKDNPISIKRYLKSKAPL